MADTISGLQFHGNVQLLISFQVKKVSLVLLTFTRYEFVKPCGLVDSKLI